VYPQTKILTDRRGTSYRKERIPT